MDSTITLRTLKVQGLVVGTVAAGAYLAGLPHLAWAAGGLAALAAADLRCALAARLAAPLLKARPDDEVQVRGLFQFDSGVQAVLIGAGAVLLPMGWALCWLPILVAAGMGLGTAATGCAYSIHLYSLLVKAGHWFFGRRGDADRILSEGDLGACYLCDALGRLPYPQCRWRETDVPVQACTLKAASLGILALAVALLVTSPAGALMTRLLVGVTLALFAAVGMIVEAEETSRAAGRQHLAESRRRLEGRCQFLERLALARTTRSAADETIRYLEETTGARRLSVMVAGGEGLRVVASRGLPKDAADALVPFGQRISGRAFELGRLMIVRHDGSEASCPSIGLKGAGPSASVPMAAAPLRIADRRIGVLNVTDKPGGEFTEADIEDLQFAAGAAGISLASQIDRGELEEANYAALRTLALAVEAKDPYTHGHAQRVCGWATAVAKALGITGRRLESLSRGAELHDIGKLAVPDNILLAPRRLTDEEWAVLKEHPRRGVELVRHLAFLKPAQKAILYHHERLDGSGYPEGLAGDDVPLEARILAVADSFDAMTTARPYRPPMSTLEAVEELRRGVGALFDERCVEAFASLVDQGAEVEMLVIA